MGEPERTEEAGAREDFITEVREWAKALALGAGDTLKEMLRAGRQAAGSAADDYWDRFDSKTRHRREKE
ncbi:MAG: hypothetical protein ACE5EF_05380 [Dehalococcoidia bacterium]